MSHWSSKYLQMDFSNTTCSAFCEYVLNDHFGKDYKFPQSQGSVFNQSAQLKKHIPEYCIETKEPKDGDLVLMNGLRRLCHVGLFVKIGVVDYVLHCEIKMGRSALHRLKDLSSYGYTLSGFYTWLR